VHPIVNGKVHQLRYGRYTATWENTKEHPQPTPEDINYFQNLEQDRFIGATGKSRWRDRATCKREHSQFILWLWQYITGLDLPPIDGSKATTKGKTSTKKRKSGKQQPGPFTLADLEDPDPFADTHTTESGGSRNKKKKKKKKKSKKYYKAKAAWEAFNTGDLANKLNSPGDVEKVCKYYLLLFGRYGQPTHTILQEAFRERQKNQRSGVPTDTSLAPVS
jgi:hypothetical protein